MGKGRLRDSLTRALSCADTLVSPVCPKHTGRGWDAWSCLPHARQARAARLLTGKGCSAPGAGEAGRAPVGLPGSLFVTALRFPSDWDTENGLYVGPS